MTEKVKFGNGESVEYDGTVNTRFTAEARAERNHRLAETDHFAVKDRTLSAEMKTYRQSLRDMDFSDPDNLTWPTKP